MIDYRSSYEIIPAQFNPSINKGERIVLCEASYLCDFSDPNHPWWDPSAIDDMFKWTDLPRKAADWDTGKTAWANLVIYSEENEILDERGDYKGAWHMWRDLNPGYSGMRVCFLNHTDNACDLDDNPSEEAKACVVSVYPKRHFDKLEADGEDAWAHTLATLFGHCKDGDTKKTLFERLEDGDVTVPAQTMGDLFKGPEYAIVLHRNASGERTVRAFSIPHHLVPQSDQP